MDDFKNKLRLIGFVPIGALADLFAEYILFSLFSILFLKWSIQDMWDGVIPQEKVTILFTLLNIPAAILGYKISHIIKPAKLTNKKFIIIHSFFIGLELAISFWLEGYQPLHLLVTTPIFILIIKDRKFNLFNMS